MCCSSSQVLWGLNMITFHMPTSTSSSTANFAIYNGEARMTACLRIALAFLVTIGRFKDLFVNSITFGTHCTVVDDY
jgi:hypothetical protein